jgi:hypothetical protein
VRSKLIAYARGIDQINQAMATSTYNGDSLMTRAPLGYTTRVFRAAGALCAHHPEELNVLRNIEAPEADIASMAFTIADEALA